MCHDIGNLFIEGRSKLALHSELKFEQECVPVGFSTHPTGMHSCSNLSAAVVVCLGGGSAQGEFLPRGCLPRGVSAWGCLPKRRCLPRGVCPGGVFPRGCTPPMDRILPRRRFLHRGVSAQEGMSAQGVCPGGCLPKGVYAPMYRILDTRL